MIFEDLVDEWLDEALRSYVSGKKTYDNSMKRLGNYFSINFRASAEKYGSVLNLENWISTWPNFADVMPTVDISSKNESYWYISLKQNHPCFVKRFERVSSISFINNFTFQLLVTNRGYLVTYQKDI